jgi:Tol biopolymer transport system component
MTDPNFDRTFTAWLDERAQPQAPAGLAADTIGRTAETRPRPAWRIPERWFSMPTTIRLALIPRGLVLTLIALGLLLSLTVASVAVGGRLPWVPALAVAPAPPTGPAANGLIAFERDEDIFVVAPDGTGARPLISASGIQATPSWSRDGTRIAYWSAPSSTAPWDVVVASADGTESVTVASGLVEPYVYDGPDWSPDGSRLVFSARTVPNGEAPCTYTAKMGEFCSSRIFTAASDGSTGAVQIGDPELDARNPVWSPDGATIAFGGGDVRTASVRLYLMRADGTDVHPVSFHTGNGWSFIRQSWSPDGTKVVGQVGYEWWDIVVVAADDSGDTMLTSTPNLDENLPSFAVDGSIGWYGNGDPCCLEVLDPDNGRTVLPGGSPVWSPDGSLVVTSPPDETDGDPPSLIVVDRQGAITATISVAGESPMAGSGVPSWQRIAR